MLFVSVILITPTTLTKLLGPLENSLEGLVGEESLLGQLLASYFSSIVLLLLNFVIIPLLIDLTCALEDHKTKSAK